jgi:hypothetical protein
VTNSTLVNNYAEDGGSVIWGDIGSHTYLHNSTVSGNESWGGGTLGSEGTLSVTFSTIVNNDGGGLMTGEIANSILVGNIDFIFTANCGMVVVLFLLLSVGMTWRSLTGLLCKNRTIRIRF